MAHEWSSTDEGTVDGPTLALEVDAVDADRRDSRDVAAFVGLVRTPPDAARGQRRTRPRDLALIFGGLFVGAAVADAVVAGLLRAGITPSPYLGVAAFIVGALLPAAVTLAWTHRQRVGRRRASLDDRFHLSLSRAGFTLRSLASGELRVPLDDVHAFEGGRRLVLVRADGTRTELACDLGAAPAHREVAARFADALPRIRASLGGYRGPRVGATPTPEPSSDHEDVERDEEAAAEPRRPGPPRL